MDDAKDDDLIGHRVKIDGVRKASHESAACLTVDARVGERCLDDTAKDHVDFRCKGAPKPWTLFLVPVTGVEQLCSACGRRTRRVSRSSEELPTYLVPGDG